ncbi:MAG: cysteine desulfurase NifS [Chloroflexi bacterium AL-W]|nr:cysteine desulfurase NifS [Chloroflexi bacterium AL-N1]NOK68985.1 cysteine desulfurase NifS [Chloroflexi bacterium AL-N10]NOK76968.1 cysteine desulfurase NifS [Chloroflexi bacterium AL-N5]NOK82644.1 cysteine desulfurase NifS [Chloroflexi bacterium AL-W]NOK90825.1 cysteine desulfurase NifS [Chloroflexi bacterium AL-N15]
MTKHTIYLDHAATTPVDEQVIAAMLPYFTQQFGNPSSIHQFGRAALAALDDARETVAAVLGANRKEVIFTGGGSESDNLAVKGVALAQRQAGKGAHVITTAIEHHAVLHAVEYLETLGFEATVLSVDADGLVRPDDLRSALRPDTVLVSIMYGNNEIGIVQPLAELGAICREHGVPLHTDAVQAAGSLPLDVDSLNVDLLTLAAHKVYGPKGIGILYARRGTPLLPQINGGGQERQRRAGTENIAGIVGMATALQLAEERRESYVVHCTALRDQFIQGVLETIPYTTLNGHPTQRLPNNANIAFEYVEGESVLLLLEQHHIAASSGSACTSGSLEASHVLLALGLPHEQAIGSVRFTVGKDISSADIDYVLETLPALIERLRSVSPEYREQVLQVV